MTRRSSLLAAAGLLLTFASATSAQDYPTRPVRVIVPFPPGAINDTVGRLIAAQLSERLGKQFVVENRAGAGSVVGSEAVANAPKDGYTLLIVSLATTVAPALYKLPYDPVTAFKPVAMVLSAPNVVLVHPEVPARSLQEFIELAKRKPGEVQYGSGGVGSFMHLGGEMFKLATGVNLLHVPYKGGGPSIQDVVAGNIHMTFEGTGVLLPLIQGGQLRALAVTAAQRNPALPDVPTVEESGYPGFVTGGWTGLLGPAGLPAPIVAKLNAAINAGLKAPALTAALAKFHADPLGGTPQDFAKLVADDIAKWRPVVSALNLKVN